MWVVSFPLQAVMTDSGTAPRMDRGLRAWTRHPNYPGDFTLWWGIGLFAVALSNAAAPRRGARVPRSPSLRPRPEPGRSAQQNWE